MRNKAMSVFETLAAVFVGRYWRLIESGNRLALKPWLRKRASRHAVVIGSNVMNTGDKTMMFYNPGIALISGAYVNNEGEGSIELSGKFSTWDLPILEKIDPKSITFPDINGVVKFRARARDKTVYEILEENGYRIEEANPEEVERFIVSKVLVDQVYIKGGFDMPGLFLKDPMKVIKEGRAIVDKYGVVYPMIL